MPSGPTYYDFFGVSRTASSEQIRAAYLWLIKQYHPDLTGQSDKQRAADFAAVLNQSYNVLKDPARRARYDEFLERDGGGLRKRKVRRALLTGETRRPARLRWDRSSMGAAALGATAFLLIAVAVWLPSSSAPADIEASSLQASSPVTAERTDVGTRALRDEVQLAMSATPLEAEVTSRRCFAAALQQAGGEHAQSCVIFDDAYLDWNIAAGGDLSQPSYFSGDVVVARHRDALAKLGSVDRRMHDLREATLTLMLEEIRSEVAKAPRRRTTEGGDGDELADLSR